MIELTRQQIARQDFVDNKIFQLLKTLRQSAKIMKWDIELIGNVRDAIGEQLLERNFVHCEAEFYPYLDHET